ncbi:hypothetical protein [Pseudothauera hydrothermalis]|jgi:hypothetical protein|nr:hypothetical protein [Pseudothauera hydrothermalis]
MCVLGVDAEAPGPAGCRLRGFSRLNGVHAVGKVSSTRHQMVLSLLREK